MLADIFTTSKFGKSVKNVTGKFKFSDIHYMTYYFGTNIILIIDLSQSQEDEGAQEHKSAEDGVDYQPLNVSV